MADIYDDVKSFFGNLGDDNVVVNSGKGAQGVKYKGKMFCMFFKGDLMIRLEPSRVGELVASGEGQAYPHSKDRVVIPAATRSKWIKYARESLDYVSS